jgi:3-oxoacyl-[acyl-carrier protein] reductase
MTPLSTATWESGTLSTGLRSVLVTGASGGIGQAVCRACAAMGWFVGIHYHRSKAAAELLLAELERAGRMAALYQADVRDAQSVQQMVTAFSRDSTRPVTFVCAAGIAGGELVLKLQDGHWDEIIATNLTGLFHCLRAMAPVLQLQGGGSIVVVGSYAGYQGAAGQAAYAASKAGVVGLVKTAALEWGPDNICVNLLWPGWQSTKLTEAAVRRRGGWRDHALGRPPALDEVIQTLVYLAQVNDVSGQVWNCDSRSLFL